MMGRTREGRALSGRAFVPAATLMTLAALLIPAAAAPASKAASSQKAALARVRAMIRAYRKMTSFEETAEQTMQAVSGSSRQKARFATSFLFRQPNRFHYQLEDGNRHITIACDGKRLWIYSSLEKSYTVQEAPKNMREMASLLDRWAPPAIEGFAFLRDDQPFGEVIAGRLAGSARLAGELVDVVELEGSPPELRQPGCKTRLYIGRKDDLLRKCEVRASRGLPPARIGGAPDRLQMSISRTLRVGKVGRPMPESAFRFRPPAGARQVAAFGSR